MMYVVREGKKRGRGAYLTSSLMYNGRPFYHYTKKQRKAIRFPTLEEARSAADSILHVETFRFVRLRGKE